MERLKLKEYIASEATCEVCGKHLTGISDLLCDDWGRVYCESCQKKNELS